MPDSKLFVSDASREVLKASVQSSFGPKLTDDLISLSEAVGKQRLEELVKEFGSIEALIRKQALGGTEFGKKHAPLALFSVTKDLGVLDTFGSSHFKARVPRSSLIKQTLESSGESEYFLTLPTRFEQIK